MGAWEIGLAGSSFSSSSSSSFLIFFYGLQDNNSFSALTGDRVEVLSSAIKLIDPCSSERSDASLEANMKLIIILESKGVGVCWLVGWFVCV